MSYNRLTCDIKIDTQAGHTVRLLQCVSIEVSTSFDTLTDNATVKIPRDTRWVIKNIHDYNEYYIVAPDDQELKSLFQAGDKIKIKMGYDFENLPVFEGFITGFEPKSPFVLFCEDAAWKLKSKKVNFAIKGKTSNRLSDFVDKLLEGTGVELHPDTNPDNITIGRINIWDMTVAQVLKNFRKKYGLLSYIKDNRLLIGRSFFSKKSSIMKTSQTNRYVPPRIDLEYDVIRDNLALHNINRRKIALKGVSRVQSNKSILMTIILDPRNDDNNPIITEFIDKRKNKSEIEKDAESLSAELGELNVNYASYQTRTIHYRGLEKEDLFEALKDDFLKIFDTGLSGNLVLFGDHNFQPASTVQIFDRTNPEKNGEYVIRSVSKSWGQDGYRQTLEMPIKFKNLA